MEVSLINRKLSLLPISLFNGHLESRNIAFCKFNQLNVLNYPGRDQNFMPTGRGQNFSGV